MPTYVILMNWTDQGVKTANETVSSAATEQTRSPRSMARVSSRSTGPSAPTTWSVS
jgi:uncharacterized protein with GYD domain